MAVNLVKNQEELLKCWKEVVDDKIPINWVLFTYEGQSYDLKVVGKGGAFTPGLFTRKLVQFQLFIGKITSTRKL